MASYIRQFNFLEFKAVGKHVTLSQRHQNSVYYVGYYFEIIDSKGLQNNQKTEFFIFANNLRKTAYKRDKLFMIVIYSKSKIKI